MDTVDKFREDLSPKSAEYQRAEKARVGVSLLLLISSADENELLTLQQAIESLQYVDPSRESRVDFSKPYHHLENFFKILKFLPFL